MLATNFAWGFKVNTLLILKAPVTPAADPSISFINLGTFRLSLQPFESEMLKSLGFYNPSSAILFIGDSLLSSELQECEFCLVRNLSLRIQRLIECDFYSALLKCSDLLLIT